MVIAHLVARADRRDRDNRGSGGSGRVSAGDDLPADVAERPAHAAHQVQMTVRSRLAAVAGSEAATARPPTSPGF
jgi:hypothetical protein